MSKMKNMLFLILALSVASVCFAASNQTDSISITTYYPSPHGVYRFMRLFPVEQPAVSQGENQPGTLYFNRTDMKVYVYKNDTLTWRAVGGDAAADRPLVYAMHTEADCTNHPLYGELVDAGVTFKQCRFGTAANPVSACPAGWTQYLQYSTVPVAMTCGTMPPRCWDQLGGPCTVSAHGWSNTISACTYTSCCHQCCWPCSGAPSQTCTADITQIGCY